MLHSMGCVRTQELTGAARVEFILVSSVQKSSKLPLQSFGQPRNPLVAPAVYLYCCQCSHVICRAHKNTRRSSGHRDGKNVAKHVTGSVMLASASSLCRDSTGEPGVVRSGGECNTTGTSVMQPKPDTQAASPNSGACTASHVEPPTSSQQSQYSASPEKSRGLRCNRRRRGQPARVDDILQQLAGGGLESVVAAARAAVAASRGQQGMGQAVKGGPERPGNTERCSEKEGHVKAEPKSGQECSDGTGRESVEHLGSGCELFEWPARGSFQGLATSIMGGPSQSTCATSQDAAPRAMRDASQDTFTSLTTSPRTSCCLSDIPMQLQGGDAERVAGEACCAQEELDNANRESVCVGCSVAARGPHVAESDTDFGVQCKTYTASVCVPHAGPQGKPNSMCGSRNLGGEPVVCFPHTPKTFNAVSAVCEAPDKESLVAVSIPLAPATPTARCGQACEGSEVLGSAPDVLPGAPAAIKETCGGGLVVMELSGHDNQEQVVKSTLTPGCSEEPGQSFVSCHFSSMSAQVAFNGRAPEQSKATQAIEREPLCSMSTEVSSGALSGCLPGLSTAAHSIKSSASKGTSTGHGFGCHLGQSIDLQGAPKESVCCLACNDHVAGGALVHDTTGAKCEAQRKIYAGWDLDFLDLEDDEVSYMETFDPSIGKLAVVALGGTRTQVAAQQQTPEEPLHMVTMQKQTGVAAEPKVGSRGLPCGSIVLQPTRELYEKGEVNTSSTPAERQEAPPSSCELTKTVASGVHGKKCGGKSVVVEGANSTPSVRSTQLICNTQDPGNGRRALALLVRPATGLQARQRACHLSPEKVGKVKRASPQAIDQIRGRVPQEKAGNKFAAVEGGSLQASFPGTALELQEHLDDLLADELAEVCAELALTTAVRVRQ
jgi:hypothetical protein